MILQKREKVLLFILLALIVYGGIASLVLYPQINKRAEYQQQLDEKYAEQDQADALILLTPGYEKNLESLKKDAQEMYSLMQQTADYDVSLMLSDMLAAYSLTPIDLTISAYTNPPLPKQQAPVNSSGSSMDAQQEEAAPDREPTKLEQQAQEVGQEAGFDTEAVPYGNGENEVSDEDVYSDYAMVRQADLTFAGTQENAQAFLDAINNHNLSILADGYIIDVQNSSETFHITLSLYEFAGPDQVAVAAGRKSQERSKE